MRQLEIYLNTYNSHVQFIFKLFTTVEPRYFEVPREMEKSSK